MKLKKEHLAGRNRQLRGKTPAEIIAAVLQEGKKAVLTTNFRPYEAAILHAVTRVQPDIPVIWCDTGYNTPQTYRHAEELTHRLGLNLFCYIPRQTAAWRQAILGMPSVEDPLHAEFTRQVKLEPFERAMKEHQPEVWFTNLRKGQTAHRDSLDILSPGHGGVLKASPFYHWSDAELDGYLRQHGLPNELRYHDPTKALENRECGLHR